MRKPVMPTLHVQHFPAPSPCPICGKLSAFQVEHALLCTSLECDPHGITFSLLDRRLKQRRATGTAAA